MVTQNYDQGNHFFVAIALNSTVLGKLLCSTQDPVPREAWGAACVSINFTTIPHPFRPSYLSSSPSLLHIRVVHSTVLQIKPVCTSLIEQNFNTGSTRNSAPWVTKHRVNTMVHSGPRCKRDSFAIIERRRGRRVAKSCVFGSLLKCNDTSGFRIVSTFD